MKPSKIASVQGKVLFFWIYTMAMSDLLYAMQL